MAKRRWQDMSGPQKAGVVALGTVQVALAGAAWADLAARSARQVNGSKAMWAVVIGVNVVGPLAYFAKGRRG